MDVDLIKENKLYGCHRRNLFFVIPGWDMTYFHLLSLVIDEQYGEDEMIQFDVFVYIFAFIFHLLFSLWKPDWHYQPLLQLSITCLFPLTLIPSSLFYLLKFVIFDRSILRAKLTVDSLTALSPCVWKWKLIRSVE